MEENLTTEVVDGKKLIEAKLPSTYLGIIIFNIRLTHRRELGVKRSFNSHAYQCQNGKAKQHDLQRRISHMHFIPHFHKPAAFQGFDTWE